MLFFIILPSYNNRYSVTVDQPGEYNILIFADRKDAKAQEDFEKYGIEYIKKENEIIKIK